MSLISQQVAVHRAKKYLATFPALFLHLLSQVLLLFLRLGGTRPPTFHACLLFFPGKALSLVLLSANVKFTMQKKKKKPFKSFAFCFFLLFFLSFFLRPTRCFHTCSIRFVWKKEHTPCDTRFSFTQKPVTLETPCFSPSFVS